MIHVCFFYLSLTAGLAASLWTLDKRLDCRQQGLKDCKINNCSDKHTVEHILAPTGPDWAPEHVGLWMDKHGAVSVLNVTWTLKEDASLFRLTGSEINILDQTSNQSMCMRFSYNISKQWNPKNNPWTFSLDGVVVEPGRTYTVTILNLPEPDIGDKRIVKPITIPGCADRRVQKSQMCLQNGSLWDPHITTNVSVDNEHRKLFIVVGFEASEYSERYQVSIQSSGLHLSKNISKSEQDNRTSQTVTFEFGLRQLLKCEMSVMIKPFFIGCKNDCMHSTTMINYCMYYPPRALIVKATVVFIICGCVAFLLWRTSKKDAVNTSSSAAKEQAEGFQLHERKKVLVIYSLDHPLYKNIVLKLCAFLATKCGTEVVLDLLDSTRLGVLGSIQWLDWHREQIEGSSEKILILCSRGVQAKWRALCGEKPVFLREDARSPVGDMLSPALSLMVPHFLRSASYEKYIVAYFDGVCSEEDVPVPLNIMVRYKLMRQFEEVFFRILDTEKHKPGRVNHIKGLSEDEYLQCPSGRALYDAIKAFHAYQLQHPHWFENELLESSELEVEETSAEICSNAKTSSNLVTYC